MLMACFDAAGKSEDLSTPIVLVGGVCSFTSVWDEFNSRWSKALVENRIPYFHAADFANYKPPFDIFRNDEIGRRKLVSELLSIMSECGLRKFGALIDKPSVQKAKKNMGMEDGPYMDDYVVCCRRVVNDLFKYARGEGIFDISVIFEKGDSEDLLRKHFRHNRLPEPDFRWSKDFTDRKGVAHHPLLGLQAAGWVAWEYYVDSCRTLGLSHEPWTAKGRVPYQAFEKMPGNIIIQNVQNPYPRILEQMISEIPNPKK